ncbi:MAG: GAF domain-containing sensor histidine kinase [Ardenticatenaceae bacterium]|nr:GAF domain-containing sensor histidine kinase [Anaerolineales bacterium]MCB8923415.1 GAF domain-containing sensor histidine kinase [Ardenticatenaceae bacterium]MCB9003860.1 GAF domain-containing sensor histidine kinase [Ardenticatenaceae bacterium]
MIEHSVQVCRVTLAIAEAEDVESILQQAAEAVRVLTGAVYAAAGLVSSQQDELSHLKLNYQNTDDGLLVSADVLAELARGLILTTYRKKQPLMADRSDSNVSLPTWLPGNGQVANWISVPLERKGQIVGALCVFEKEGAANFSRRDQELLAVVAAHTAVSLHKVQLIERRKAHSEQLDERNRQLAAFSLAATNIAGELALDKVLQQIVDSARELIRSEYAALGVPGTDGFLEAFVHSGMSAQQLKQMSHLPKGLGLLGAIVREKRPIRIPKISADPRSIDFPEGHPQMSSFLGVPIVAGGRTLGNLYLTNKIDGPEFTADDQKLAELLATHAAVALQNARLYEQVGRLVIVEERTRIGMDLHDGIIQSIYAVGLTLESVRLTLNDNNREDADRLLELAIEGLNDTIRDIRNFILDLRPHRFQGNLQEGLARLVREFQANTMVEVTLRARAEDLDLRTPLARAVFFTTQEALANVARHARAKRVEVTIQRTARNVMLHVQDDGRGFDMRIRSVTVGHGLSNMRSRAEDLKGVFKLQSAPGEGTAVTLTLPLDEEK